MGIGRRQGGLVPYGFKNVQQKVCFLISSGINQISPLLALTWKNFGKIP